MKKTILAVAVISMFAVTGAFAADAALCAGSEQGCCCKHECCCCAQDSEEGKKQGGHMCKMHDKKPAAEEKASQPVQPAQQHVH